MNNIFKIPDLDIQCTGCFACSNKCPYEAIEMLLDKEGFYYPNVDLKKCVGCGLCLKSCQIKFATQNVNNPYKIISGYAHDEAIRMLSSSGGIFALLCNSILKIGGIAYGAAFDSDHKEVCHTSTNRVSLNEIMRSKYVQSKIGNIYSDIEKELENGKMVLFSGTPCHVKGLQGYLQKEYNNLITIDFMCHGVPSTGLFKDMLSYYEHCENSEVLDITFREKDYGWFNQVTKIYLKNGKVLSQKSSDYYYYYLFLSNYTLRKSCMDCQCYNTHTSDITLADNWSIKGDNKGISLILLNTNKGCKTLEDITKEIKILGDGISFKGYDVYQHNYNSSSREKFFSYYVKHGFEKTLNSFITKVMKKNKIKRYYSAIINKTKHFINRWQGTDTTWRNQ